MTIGHAVVHYALAAHSFSAGIKCRHCITFFTRYLGFYNMVIVYLPFVIYLCYFNINLMNNNRENILFFRLLKGFTKTVMQQMNNEKFMRWKMSHLTNVFKCRNVLCEEGKTDSHIMWYIEKVCHNKVFLKKLITSHI